VSHHDRMPVILEPEEFELVAHRARPGYPGSGGELTKRRRDRDKPLSVWPCVASWISSGKPCGKPRSFEQQSLRASRRLLFSLAARRDVITGPYCKAASPLSTKVFRRRIASPVGAPVSSRTGEASGGYAEKSAGIFKRRRRRVCTLGPLVVISLFAALCAASAIVLDQGFFAAIFVAELAFALVEAIRRSR
jgi:hypothetical protein